jgi:hypothetical protein
MKNQEIKFFITFGNLKVSKDDELLKKLEDDIWEFRTLYNKIAYRLFAFWDETEKSMIIATHGI